MENKNFYYIKNYEEKDVLIYKKDNEEFQLNSMYNTDEFIDIWCSQFHLDNPHSVAVVIGVADGRYINKLYDNNKDITIVVYESDYELLEYVYKNEIKKDIKNIFFFSEKDNIEIFYKVINNQISYSNCRYVEVCVSPNYERMYSKLAIEITKFVGEMLKDMLYERNTLYVMGNSIANNICNNMIDFSLQYALQDFIKCYKENIVDERPIIIVSAGPSLDKNIQDLKKAKDKFMILAVDTALNPLAKAGIIPDLTITIDPEKPVILFENELMNNVPMVFYISSNYEIKSVHKGIRIYDNVCSTPIGEIYDKYKGEFDHMQTGGSVANNAYSLAKMLGTKTVIFIGQDLAYPNDQEHATDSFGKDHYNYIKDDGKKYFYVDDNYGGKIKTEPNMDKYRKWFEYEVSCNPGIKYINATEGGAKINGMEFIPLKDAIARYDSQFDKMNFGEIFNKIPKALTREQQKEVLTYLANFEDRMKEIASELKDKKQYYDKLEECNRKGNYTGKKFKESYKKITETTDWVLYNKEVAFLTNFTYFDDYNVMTNIYDKKDSLYDDIRFSVDNGKKTLDSLVRATEVALERLKDSISEAKELLKEYE